MFLQKNNNDSLLTHINSRKCCILKHLNILEHLTFNQVVRGSSPRCLIRSCIFVDNPQKYSFFCIFIKNGVYIR